MSDDPIRLGAFALDVQGRRLLRDGEAVRLGGRAFDVLAALAAAGGNTVSKEALFAQVWPSQIVEDNALQVQISAVRRALGEMDPGASYVVTVPGRGYRLLGLPAELSSRAASSAGDLSSPRSLSTRSIAVLPFRNVSSDREQEYFVDGMVEDIITGLSRIRWLSVIARNSSFSFKGCNIDVKQIGRDLCVTYIVEGSVRKADNRIRVTVQLVEAETGIHLWAERYDRLLDDIFALQDELTMSIVGAIEPTLRRAEIERVKRARPENLDAYDLVLRAMPHVHSHLAAETANAIPLLKQALRLEPGYAAAHATLALSYHSRFSRGVHDRADRDAAIRHARAASSDAVDDASALGISGFVISLDEHDHDFARHLFKRALNLSRSDIFTLWCSSIALSWWGELDTAIDRATRALQLSPFDPHNYLAYNALAISYFPMGRFREAYEAARRSVQMSPRFSVSHSLLVAALVGLGQEEDARRCARQLLAADPHFSVRQFGDTVNVNGEVFAPFAQAWRNAGIPEG